MKQKKQSFYKAFKKMDLKHKVTYILIGVILGSPIFIPLILNLIAYITTRGYFFTSGDLLIYFGTLLTFIGTLTLGAVAFYQNNKIVKVNKDILNAQMDYKNAIFEVSDALDPKINECDKENHFNLVFDFKLLCVNGMNFNTIIIFKELYTNDNYWADEYAQHRYKKISENRLEIDEAFAIPKLDLGLSFRIDVPQNVISKKKLLVLHAKISHYDIYRRNHVESLKLLYTIESSDCFKYEAYSIIPSSV